MTPKKRNRNLTSQIYQSQIQQSTSSGSDPDQKVRFWIEIDRKWQKFS